LPALAISSKMFGYRVIPPKYPFVHSTLRATKTITGAALIPKGGIPLPGHHTNKLPPKKICLTNYSLGKHLLTGDFAITSGIGVNQQAVRYVHFEAHKGHTTYQVPNSFDHYRRNNTKDPKATTDPEKQSVRQNFTYLTAAIGGTINIAGAKAMVQTAVSVMNPSADVLALSKIEVDLNKVPEGRGLTFKWRGKPLFVRHRTQEEIDVESKVDHTQLRDPQTDAERVQKPEWLIVVGVCTHLGCVPITHAGEWGGYFCPCHGSHYDASGRIRKGPAPLNLEVPEYTFMDDHTIVVG